jgi:hypothetical protein
VKDLHFLNKSSIREAVQAKVSTWIRKAELQFPSNVPLQADQHIEPAQAQLAGQPAETDKNAITKVRKSILAQLQKKLNLDKRDFLAHKLGTDPSTLRAIARCDFESHGGRDVEGALFNLLTEHNLEKDWGPRFPPPGCTG